MTMIDSICAAIADVDHDAAQQTRTRIDALAKPPGSLGRVEDLAVTLAGIAGQCPPPVPTTPVLLVFAADHGVVDQGVSRWPREVTRAMVDLFLSGRAACNSLARVVGAEVFVVDVGVATVPSSHSGLIDRRVRSGTRDMTLEPAMTDDECRQAIVAGAEVVWSAVSRGADLVLVGDMGIGNTTAAAAIVAAMTGHDPDQVVGPGADADAATLARKHAVVRRALGKHAPNPDDPIAVLRSVGGLEHAGIVGAILQAAALRIPVVLDGVNTNAAALVAVELCPASRGYLLAGHRSHEPGASVALEALGLSPVADLEMRLGEGTGALLAVPVLHAAAAVSGEMAQLSEVAG